MYTKKIIVKDIKIVAMNYRKKLYKLYINVKNVNLNEKFKWNIL